MAKLNDSKNTKQDFVEAYKTQLTEIESLKAALANPQEQVTAKKSAETLEIANKVVNGNITSVVGALQTEVAAILEGLVSKVTNGSQELVSLQEAIDIKKSDIKQLFDIEATAYSVTALLNTEKTLKNEFDVAKKERANELQLIINDLNTQISNVKGTLTAKLNEIDDQVNAARKKALTEFDYEIKRKKQVDNDLWSDEKKQRERDLSELETAVDKREADVTVREEKVSELEATVATIPTLVKDAEEKGKKTGKDEAEKSFGFERRAIEAGAKTNVTIAENKVTMLEATVERQNDEIVQLKADLKAAYVQVQLTATSAVEAQANANARMVTSIETTARESNKFQK